MTLLFPRSAMPELAAIAGVEADVGALLETVDATLEGNVAAFDAVALDAALLEHFAGRIAGREEVPDSAIFAVVAHLLGLRRFELLRPGIDAKFALLSPVLRR
jgi:hypothetical protein